MSSHLGKLVIISAASGVGKTTLKDRVLPDFPTLKYSISATTRSPREGEVNGEHYFFKTREEFQSMIEKDELVEYMEVHNNYYGTPKKFIEQMLLEGKNVLLDLDVYGKKNFDRIFPEAIGILIMPPSFETLAERLNTRATDSEETIKLRLENATKEMDFAMTQGKYEHTLINDNLEVCVADFEALLSKVLN
jgi:guanylate kinase